MSEKSEASGGLDESGLPVAASILVVLCTFPNQETARAVAKELVTGKLAACANIIPKIESIYEWEGKIENVEEVLAIFKISSENCGRFEAALLKLHPYDTPEMVAIGVDRVNRAYLDWVLSK